MIVDALVPLKRLDYAKTRLATVLDPPARVRVMRALLAHTLEVVEAAPSVASVTLVSSAIAGASTATSTIAGCRGTTRWPLRSPRR